MSTFRDAIEVPDELPFLEALQWSGAPKQVYQWAPLTMLRRYEEGWALRGVIGEPSSDELQFVRHLIRRYRSYLHEEELR